LSAKSPEAEKPPAPAPDPAQQEAAADEAAPAEKKQPAGMVIPPRNPQASPPTGAAGATGKSEALAAVDEKETEIQPTEEDRMPSAVDLDDVMREMKEKSIGAKIGNKTKEIGVGTAQFAAEHKILLSIFSAIILLIIGGVYAWQIVYPQFLKGSIKDLYAAEQYSETLEAVEKFRVYDPNDSEIIYIAALSNLKLQQFDQALLEIQILSGLDSGSGGAQSDIDFIFYRALVSDKNIANALDLLAKVLEAEPDHLPGILLRGIYANIPSSGLDIVAKDAHLQTKLRAETVDSQRYAEQITILLTYLAAKSDELFAPVRAPLSENFTQTDIGDDEGYLLGFENLYSLDLRGLVEADGQLPPGLATNILKLLGIYASAEPRDEERTTLVEVIMRSASQTANPLSDMAKFVAGPHYAIIGDYETARELFEEVSTKAPGSAAPRLNRANARLQIDRSDFFGVAEELNSVLGIDPKNVIALNNRGFINLWLADNINKAQQDFLQVSQARPDDMVSIYNLAQAYLLSGEPKKAVDQFGRVIEENPAFGNSLLYRGLAHQQGRSLELAVKDFNDFKLLQPGNVLPYIRSAELFDSSAGYKLALNELRTAMEIQPNNPEISLILADFYLKAEQSDNAQEIFDKLDPDEVDELDLKLLEGRLRLQKEEPGAEELLKEVYETYAQAGTGAEISVAVYYLAALEYNENIDAILDLTRTLLPKDPDNVELLKGRASALNRRGSNDEALRFALRAVEVDPLNFDVQLSLGDIYATTGRFQEAIDAYRTAQKIRPADLSALYKLETLLDLLNEPEELANIREQIERVESQQLLERESELALSDIESESSGVVAAAATEAQIAQLENSLGDINEKIGENPDSAVLYYNRGVVEMTIGDNLSAVDSMLQALDIEPENAEYQMGLAQAYLRTDDFSGAVSVLDEVLEADPDNFEAVYNRAVAYHNSGDQENAILDYTTAIRLNPAFASAYYNRGTIYVSIAEYYRAIEEFTRVIELNPDQVKPYLARAQVYRVVGEDSKAESDLQAAQLLRASTVQ